jgi:hypothetical protein
MKVMANATAGAFPCTQDAVVYFAWPAMKVEFWCHKRPEGPHRQD